jgi:hypothetical protein
MPWLRRMYCATRTFRQRPRLCQADSGRGSCGAADAGRKSSLQIHAESADRWGVATIPLQQGGQMEQLDI